eukprot:193506-Chlamydomonas_euryale.AAC.1
MESHYGIMKCDNAHIPCAQGWMARVSQHVERNILLCVRSGGEEREGMEGQARGASSATLSAAPDATLPLMLGKRRERGCCADVCEMLCGSAVRNKGQRGEASTRAGIQLVEGSRCHIVEVAVPYFLGPGSTPTWCHTNQMPSKCHTHLMRHLVPH